MPLNINVYGKFGDCSPDYWFGPPDIYFHFGGHQHNDIHHKSSDINEFDVAINNYFFKYFAGQ